MATSAGRAAARLLVGDAECPPFVGMTTKVYEASSEDGNRDRLCMGGSTCTMQYYWLARCGGIDCAKLKAAGFVATLCFYFKGRSNSTESALGN